jgi:proteasome lid subunit RPN8/RPN11
MCFPGFPVSKARSPGNLRLVVDVRLPRALGELAERAQPREVCGLLFARDGLAVAVAFAPAVAAVAWPGGFEIPDAELRRIRAWGVDRGLQVVALFHSHPSGDPRLSASDRAALRYSEWPWIVVTHDRRNGSAVLTGYARGDGAPIEIATVG